MMGSWVRVPQAAPLLPAGCPGDSRGQQSRAGSRGKSATASFESPEEKATRPRAVQFWGFDRVTLSPLPVRDAGKDRDGSVMRQMRGTGFHKVNVTGISNENARHQRAPRAPVCAG